MKSYKLGVIGAGFMATALIKGAIESGVLFANEIFVTDLSNDALDRISTLGVIVTGDVKELVDNSKFVLFAVKPQNLNDVLLAIKDCSCEKFISIMAGVKKQKIKAVFNNAKIARCMPNTPCSIGCGAVGLDVSDFSSEDSKFIIDLLQSIASVSLVGEDKLNAVTGISGSAPAYFYLFLKSVIDAGVKNGLSYEEAKKLATSTMIGAGKMVEQNPEKSIEQLIDAVCSKGGTTIEAVKVYKESGLFDISDRAVNACVKRSFELENL